MNVVIPMAGRGSRLAGHPSGLPKPLIEIGGRPLWSWAASCLPLERAERLVLVCLREHVSAYGLDAAFAEEFDGLPLRLVVLDDVTDGQLRTVVASAGEWQLDAPLLVYNADTWFLHDQAQLLASLERHDGVLGVAEKPGDRWSFARVDDTGRVVEVAEKRRISNWACTGLYHFRDARRFLADAQAMFDAGDRTKGEYFVAPLYERMIARGESVGIAVAEQFMPLGTPEELEAFAEMVSR